MSFEKFVKSVSGHFKAIPEGERMRQLKEIYERETGKSVNTKPNRKKVKKL
jgi:hypothetical protein